MNKSKHDFIHRMNKVMLGCLISVSPLVVNQVASAAGVDFEDQGIPHNTQKDPNPASVTSGGFKFDFGSTSAENGWNHLYIGSEQFWAYNGSTVC